MRMELRIMRKKKKDKNDNIRIIKNKKYYIIFLKKDYQ